MNKTELFEAAHRYPAKTCIVMGDSGPKITGKWGEIEQVGNSWDIWMHNPKDIAKGLFTGRINRAAETLENLTAKGPITKLDGELWVRVPNLDEIALIGPVLGIRKYRRPTESQLQNFKKLQESLA